MTSETTLQIVVLLVIVGTLAFLGRRTSKDPPAVWVGKISVSDDEYGPNGAQIRSLWEWLGTLDEEGWEGLLLAEWSLEAEWDRGSPEFREHVKVARDMVKYSAEIRNRVRENAMRIGEWEALSDLYVATAGPQAQLGIDAASRNSIRPPVQRKCWPWRMCTRGW